ncbi:MAG: (d)CMP kinase [Clostridia bacterium]
MINIAIDGPSGAGKSTIAKALAKKLNITYLDTGAMYRAFGLKAIRLDINPNNRQQVLTILNTTDVQIKYEDGCQKVLLDGEDVSVEIRTHIISRAASDISKVPEVRIKMVQIQRQIASTTDVVLDGRDTTSYVLPNAKYKFFLTAKPEERAKRRQLELASRGEIIDFNKILTDIIARDKNDTERKFAPLTQTKDAILIDSTNMSFDEVLNKILSYIK